ncbi:MAG: hypothetical protein JWN03_624 [Nocardia sp.]|uniref:hypothetical protein n=1 Tax=Nocardia sp. TaxID=1821 RepID=UPI00262B44D9|nr:hypothetical protein [Nocardia sp.]MCU1640349.1 hypothetical protein [Nocardia sp.]
MADAWLCTGIDPDALDDTFLVVAVDPDGPVGECAVAGLAVWGSEAGQAVCVLQTDGWVERTLDGDQLTVDLVAYPRLFSHIPAEVAEFPDRSEVDPDAVRLLRAVVTVDPAAYELTSEATVVFEAPAGTSAAEVVATIQAREDWPVIYAPAPTGPQD